MRTLVALALLSAAAPLPARAAPPELRGFEWNADLGVGLVRTSARRNGITQAVTGLGAAHALSLSYGDRPGLMFGLEYWGTAALGPDLETVAPSSGSGLGFHAWGIGPRVRWMLPSGAFVAVAPALTRVSLSDNDQARFSWRWGLGLRGAAGKVWLVGERWTLGVAGVAQAGVNRQSEYASPRWTNLGAGIVLVAGVR